MYTLDDIKQKLEDLGHDHVVTDIRFTAEYPDTLEADIRLKLFHRDGLNTEMTLEELFDNAKPF